MLEQILSFERELFLTINNFHTAFLDHALWLFTGMWVWIPVVFFFFATLIYGKSVKEWGPVLVALLAVVLLGHLFVAGIFKPAFARLRPVFHPDFMHDIKTMGDYTGGGLYGFISGHATFSFGFAMFTSLLFRYKPYTVVVFLWAVVMIYSRVYFGVHFLSDVAAGTLMGIINGIGVYYLYTLYINRKHDKTMLPGGLYSPCRKRVITGVLAGYIILFVLLGKQIVYVMQ